MTRTEAIQTVTIRVQSVSGVQLSNDDIATIVDRYVRWTEYAAETAYSVGDMVRLSDATNNGRLYRCRVAGTSSATASEPDWPDNLAGFMGQLITDGDTLIWEDAGPESLGQYDVAGAESEAWLLKATRVSEYTDWSSPDASVKASQEVAEYRRRATLRQPVFVV